VTGTDIDRLLDELWSSGHPVVNVIRFVSKDDTKPAR
jgi:hypothetical protein